MEQLQISRGNANLNIRALIDWGLVEKIIKTGERREFFKAEKDIWKVFTQVVKERRKRELEPVLKALEEISKVEGDKKDAEVKEFLKVTGDLRDFAQKADKTLDRFIKADENWFLSSFMKLIR